MRRGEGGRRVAFPATSGRAMQKSPQAASVIPTRATMFFSLEFLAGAPVCPVAIMIYRRGRRRTLVHNHRVCPYVSRATLVAAGCFHSATILCMFRGLEHTGIAS